MISPLYANLCTCSGKDQDGVDGYNDFLSSAIITIKGVVSSKFGGLPAMVSSAVNDLEDAIEDEIDLARFVKCKTKANL